MSAICQRDSSQLKFKKPYIRFMNHSGIIISCTNITIVIDYYTDPEASLAPYLESENRLVYLVSHSHYDHWNPDILQWSSQKDSYYIFDSTCKEYFRLNPYELRNKNIHFIQKGDSLENLKVFHHVFENFKVFDSTDTGSSFYFKVDGVNFFHAGDLNNWDWQDEDSLAMESKYRSEVKCLQRYLLDINEKIDFSFIPVDGRLLSKALSGAEIFIEEIKPSFLIPIHLNGGIDNPQKLAKSEYGDISKIINLQRPGDQVDVNGLRIPPCLKDVY